MTKKDYSRSMEISRAYSIAHTFFVNSEFNEKGIKIDSKQAIMQKEQQRELTPEFWKKANLVFKDLESGMLEQELGIVLKKPKT